MTRIFITGIRGFLGRSLARALAQEGKAVVGSVSGSAKLDDLPPGCLQGHLLKLGGPVPEGAFVNTDAVIHCAHDFSPNAYGRNVRGTRQIANSASREGVDFQVFISSYSAFETATSDYGRSKYALERFFLEEGHAVVRLGLVIGNGGLCGRIMALIKRSPVVPLISGGRSEVPVVALQDFVAAVSNVLLGRQRGLKRIYLPQRVSLRELVEEVRAACDSRSMLLPVPYPIAYSGVWMANRLGVQLSIDLDNLRGLRDNQQVTEPSDLMELVPQPLTSLGEMVRQARASSS